MPRPLQGRADRAQPRQRFARVRAGRGSPSLPPHIPRQHPRCKTLQGRSGNPKAEGRYRGRGRGGAGDAGVRQGLHVRRVLRGIGRGRY